MNDKQETTEERGARILCAWMQMGGTTQQSMARVFDAEIERVRPSIESAAVLAATPEIERRARIEAMEKCIEIARPKQGFAYTEDMRASRQSVEEDIRREISRERARQSEEQPRVDPSDSSTWPRGGGDGAGGGIVTITGGKQTVPSPSRPLTEEDVRRIAADIAAKVSRSAAGDADTLKEGLDGLAKRLATLESDRDLTAKMYGELRAARPAPAAEEGEEVKALRTLERAFREAVRAEFERTTAECNALRRLDEIRARRAAPQEKKP